jgi:hypothetical protein
LWYKQANSYDFPASGIVGFAAPDGWVAMNGRKDMQASYTTYEVKGGFFILPDSPSRKSWFRHA